MTRGVSSFLFLLLAFFAVTATGFFMLSLKSTIQRAELHGTLETEKISKNLGNLPQIGEVKAIKEDPLSALVVLEYYGFDPLPLDTLRLAIHLPNGSVFYLFPAVIIEPDECLTPDFRTIKPGAYCLFIVNASEGLRSSAFTFENSSIGVYPVIFNNVSLTGMLTGGGKGVSGEVDNNYFSNKHALTPEDNRIFVYGNQGFKVESGIIKVDKLSLGGYFTFALLSNTTVFGWGGNYDGQLGLGDYSNRYRPTWIFTLEGKNIIKIASGCCHACALLGNGSIYCWGYNGHGNCGIGDFTTFVYLPRAVKFNPGIRLVDVEAGVHHNCAIAENGTIYCWGYNAYGQLGVGDTTKRALPVAVRKMEGYRVVKLSLGHHTCALLENGSVYCWGRNDCGQLGLGYFNTTAPYGELEPKYVKALEDLEISTIVGRSGENCALLNNGSVYCWGRNDYGQMGIGITSTGEPLPRAVKLLGKAKQVTVGCCHICALLVNGSLYCWGWNAYGQLGLGDTTDRHLPAAVEDLENADIAQVVAGGRHTCALLSNGSVYCWGYNYYGELGLGDSASRYEPANLAFFEEYYSNQS